MRREVDDEDGVGSSSDRISQLPESILLHILCFLSQKKAIQTSVLSKSWRHLGPTRPVIRLRGACDCFHTVRTKFCENCFSGNNEAFLNVLENTFQRYLDQNLSTKELRLEISEDHTQFISVLGKWIRIFIKPNTRLSMFHLSVDDYIYVASTNPDSWTCLELPSAVFKVESLENLYLHRCKISSIDSAMLKNLKKLTLSDVYVDNESLKKIMSGCPLVQYVKLESCKGLKTISVANENQYLKDFKFVGCYVKKIVLDVIEIDDSWTCLELPSAVFKVESLENLYLHRCKISSIDSAMLKNLKKLTLSDVYVDNESLKKIMSGCPLVQYVKLESCKGLKTISVANENQYLKDFKFVGCYVKKIVLDVIEIDAPALQSIYIQICLNWKLNPDNYFPHLKSLHLFFVQLSTESFENFSYNFPLLEEFELYCCGGFEEIQLFSPSLKHLTIRLDSPIKVDIDAPNILRIEFSGVFLPTTISLTTASKEWKSKIMLDNDVFFFDDVLQRFLDLNEMVKAVSQSQITLDISETMFHESQLIECGIHDYPVVVENLEIRETRSNFNPIPCLFYALFQICRPRYVTAQYDFSSSRYSNGSVGSQMFGSGYVNESVDSQTMVECIRKTLIHEREKKEYYWQQHLEEVIIEAYDSGERVWHCVQGKCTSDYKLIRFGLKWSE